MVRSTPHDIGRFAGCRAGQASAYNGPGPRGAHLAGDIGGGIIPHPHRGANTTYRHAPTRHLQSQPDFEVVGEALSRVGTLVPDVILLDRELPATDASGTIRAITQAVPSARVTSFSIVQTGPAAPAGS
jgi:hypothetical protein